MDDTSKITRISVSERDNIIGHFQEKFMYYQTDNMFEVIRENSRFKMTPEQFFEYGKHSDGECSLDCYWCAEEESIHVPNITQDEMHKISPISGQMIRVKNTKNKYIGRPSHRFIRRIKKNGVLYLCINGIWNRVLKHTYKERKCSEHDRCYCIEKRRKEFKIVIDDYQ